MPPDFARQVEEELGPHHLASLGVRAGIAGEPIVQEVHASAAHTFRAAPWGAWIVGSAAHPVGGDKLQMKVAVGVGCCAEIRSDTAMVARRTDSRGGPAPTLGPSSMVTTVTVASDALLTWAPEPGVASGGCEHISESVVQLASNARLSWQEEFMLDRRSAGPPGTWRSRLRVTRDSWPVVAFEVGIGPASPLWSSPAVLDGAPSFCSLVVIDPGESKETWQPSRVRLGRAVGVSLPLSSAGVQIMAWGDSLAECRPVVERILGLAGVPGWAQVRWNTAAGYRSD